MKTVMARAEDQLSSPVERHTGWLLPLIIFLMTASICAIILIYYFAPSPRMFVEQQPAPTADTHTVHMTVHDTHFSIPANYLVYDRERAGGRQADVALFAALPNLLGIPRPARKSSPATRRIRPSFTF